MTLSRSRKPKRPIPQINRNKAKTREADVDGESPALQLRRHRAALAPGAIADGKLACMEAAAGRRDAQARIGRRVLAQG